MKFINNQVIKQFEKAGWTAGRSILNQIKLPIETYPDFVKLFLNEYGLLKVQDIDYKSEIQTYVASFIEFNPDISKGEYEDDGNIDYYSSILQKELYCLGYYTPDAYDICCDAGGRVYMLGEYCYYRGNSIYEGIENILLGWDNTLQLDEDTGKWWNMDAEYVELPTLE